MTDGLHRIDGPDGLAALGGGAALDAATWALTRPDAHFVMIREEALAGRASVWWTDGPALPGDPDARVGRIGHAVWASAEAGRQLVEAGMRALAEAECTVALGPLDGSTWFPYRVVTEWAPDGGDAAPPFWLEPTPPAQVNAAFEAAGFAPVAHYLSSRVDALPDASERLAGNLRQLEERGIYVRAFDATRGGEELVALHPLLLRAFAANRFYTPLDLDRFLASYGALLPHIDPRLILIAERENEPVGVVLGLPDLAEAARGEPVDTVIVKTLAVDPDAQGLGLGGRLARAVEEAARTAGMTRAIHALMHADNRSLQISRHTGRPIRRYALLGRAL